MNMFHHSLYRQHNSKIMYLNKTRLGRSCLNDQAILLEQNTLKGVNQAVYFGRLDSSFQYEINSFSIKIKLSAAIQQNIFLVKVEN